MIAGMSGKLPESDNLQEFWANLIGGVDMVTEDDRRWKPGEWAACSGPSPCHLATRGRPGREGLGSGLHLGRRGGSPWHVSRPVLQPG